MNRTETAENIAHSALSFVRRARLNGCANTVTDLAIQEAAQVLGISGSDYSMRTVWRMVRRDFRIYGESDMLSKPGQRGR